METDQERAAFSDLIKNAKQLPENTMIVLPVSSLDLKSAGESGASNSSSSGQCYTDAAWEEVAAIVNSDIELAFPTTKWRLAKALASRILRTKALCVTRDGQFVYIKHLVNMSHQGGGGGGRKNRRRWRKKNKKKQQQQQQLPFITSPIMSRVQVNLLNFIRDVQRQAMPLTEKLTPEWRQYRAIVQVLKERGAPNFLFKNKVICK